VPHSKETVTLVAVPIVVRLPFKVAELVVTLPAAFVITVGGTVLIEVIAALALINPYP